MAAVDKALKHRADEKAIPWRILWMRKRQVMYAAVVLFSPVLLLPSSALSQRGQATVLNEAIPVDVTLSAPSLTLELPSLSPDGQLLAYTVEDPQRKPTLENSGARRFTDTG